MNLLKLLRITSPVLIALMAAAPAQEAAALALTRGPYLQTGTSSGLIVRWRSDLASDSRVRVGTSPANLNLTFDQPASTTEHIVQVNGLNPQTKYYYSIGSTTQVISGADSNTYFTTAPTTGTQQPTRIWVIGDAGNGSAGQTAVYNAYRNFTGANPTHLWLQLGDNAYNSGTDAEYQSNMFNMYPDMFRQSVTWPTLGNHDGASADSATQTGPYYNIFSLPKNGEAGGVASGTEAYYSFDYGNIHFIVLDSHDSVRTAGSPMLTWLESDLQASNAEWNIAFWHHPPYSKGSHDSDTESQMVEMRQNTLPILEAYGIDLVLTGHSHAYERSKFIDGHYGLSSTFSDATHVVQTGSGRTDGTGAYNKPVGGVAHAGTVYAVAGSSGSIGGGTLNHPAMYLSLNELGSMVLDVNGLTLDAKFLNNNGTVRDYFTLTKGGTPPPQLANVSGVVWQDVNADGIRVAGESFLQGIEVRLYTDTNALVATQSTNSSGGYQFASVAAGNYYVRFTPGTRSISPQDQGANDSIDSDASPADGKTAVFNAAAGSSIVNVDAGMFTPGGAPQTVQLQDGLNAYAGTQDTHVASNKATTNYGNATTMLADGSDATYGRLIGLMKWTVSSIPSSATVTNATVTLRVSNKSVGNYNLYAVNTAWSEGTATWNSVNPLANQGLLIGSFLPSATGSYTIQLNSAGISLVQSWVNGSAANNGFMIVDGGTSDGVDLRSSEYGTQAQRPKLTVTYQ
ncbi:DNRLRE domain-containing protein [Methylobacter sp.]|uniref:DNRLRE domain-containing protein n=1 Tax=Methylobacter sp. TaxID=2051955 RepID=UPI00121CD4D8|nr:DNRLRE domain-containing protein [Methylobacter sp.]TAK62779.1 MAG: DNRLRE domain-containing protein [Methylobacter sp.]